MAEDSASGNVRRTRPRCDRFVLMDQDDEFVVADSGARSLWLANILDASLGNHRLVIILVTLRFVAKGNVGASCLRRLECLSDRKVTKFVQHRAKLVVTSISACGAADERSQRFEQSAGQPDHLLRLRLCFVGFGIWKLTRVSL